MGRLEHILPDSTGRLNKPDLDVLCRRDQTAIPYSRDCIGDGLQITCAVFIWTKLGASIPAAGFMRDRCERPWRFTDRR